jgi:hypothetical protein
MTGHGATVPCHPERQRRIRSQPYPPAGHVILSGSEGSAVGYDGFWTFNCHQRTNPYGGTNRPIHLLASHQSYVKQISFTDYVTYNTSLDNTHR